MKRAAKIALSLIAGVSTLITIAVVLFLMWLPRPAFAQSPQHRVNQPIPQAAHTHRATLTRAAHTQWGLDAPIAALAAQVHQESGWRQGALSPVGAHGLAQFMPATATWWCAREKTSAAECEPYNPTWALRSMVGYNKYLYARTPARYEPYDRYWVALRGYNGGLGHWQAEARATGLALPTRAQADAACGQARRARLHCPENLGYPQRILLTLQPRYAAWGLQMLPITGLNREARL